MAYPQQNVGEQMENIKSSKERQSLQNQGSRSLTKHSPFWSYVFQGVCGDFETKDAKGRIKLNYTFFFIGNMFIRNLHVESSKIKKL